jgi:hypothetical protein
LETLARSCIWEANYEKRYSYDYRAPEKVRLVPEEGFDWRIGGSLVVRRRKMGEGERDRVIVPVGNDC